MIWYSHSHTQLSVIAKKIDFISIFLINNTQSLWMEIGIVSWFVRESFKSYFVNWTTRWVAGYGPRRKEAPVVDGGGSAASAALSLSRNDGESLESRTHRDAERWGRTWPRISRRPTALDAHAPSPAPPLWLT